MTTSVVKRKRAPLSTLGFATKLFAGVVKMLIGACFIFLYVLPLSAFRQLTAGKDAIEARLKSRRESLEMLTEEAVDAVKSKCEQKYKDTVKSVQWDLDISQHCVIGGNPEEATSLVVLLHGFPECWYTWHEVLPQLVNKGHFVVAPDMRGYGLSSAPLEISEYTVPALADDNKAIIKHVREKIAPKIQTVTVVGHDWGGVPAAELGMTAPDVVDRCVLVNIPHPRIMFSKPQMKRAPWQLFMSYYMVLFQIPGLFEYINKGVPMFSGANDGLSKFGKKLVAATQAYNTRQMLNYYRAPLLNVPLGHMVRSIWKFGPFSPKAYAAPPKKHVLTRARGSAMKMPLMQIMGTGDDFIATELAQILEDNPEKYAPEGCEVAYIEGAPHFTPTATPTEVAANVHRFIEETPASE